MSEAASLIQPNVTSIGRLTDACGDDFVWGVSTSAYQCEGAHRADGKGPSIWDEFSQRKGSIYGGHNANDACDFYNRYHSDLKMVSELGIRNFRTSISWPRIFPLGSGKVNAAGVDFYQRLIDRCLELGITPWLTLYHWDLPLELSRKGGWTNRAVLGWFEEYAQICAQYFGDRVKHWMVLNEPMVFTGAGYFFGIHAPGRKNLNEFLASAHHAALAQAVGGRVLRCLVSNAEIGTTVSCAQVTPWRQTEADFRAALKVDALLNRLFVEPMLGMGYPLDALKGLHVIEKYVQTGDEDRMRFDFDFLGIQCYTREVVRYSVFTPLLRAKVVAHEKRGGARTDMNWEVFPETIYNMIMKYSQYAGIKKIIVTENGAAFPDNAEGSIVRDPARMNFLDDHIKQVVRARLDGGKVDGYFVWTLLDNFEWAEGFRPRFGLIYVDFKTQRRVIKSSALWYSELINGR